MKIQANLQNIYFILYYIVQNVTENKVCYFLTLLSPKHESSHLLCDRAVTMDLLQI